MPPVVTREQPVEQAPCARCRRAGGRWATERSGLSLSSMQRRRRHDVGHCQLALSRRSARPRDRPSLRRGRSRRRLSLVLPLMLTAAASMPSAPARFARIASRYGTQLRPLGDHRDIDVDDAIPRCADEVASRCAAAARLSASFHCGSVSGNSRPMSPAPAAPSTASVTAWQTMSASEWPSRPARTECDAGENQRAPGDQAMQIVAGADADRAAGGAVAAPARAALAEIVGRRDLDVRRIALDDVHGEPRALDQHGFVGDRGVAAARASACVEHVAAERLRRLRQENRLARQRRANDPLAAPSAGPPASPCRCTGSAAIAAPCSAGGPDRALDQIARVTNGRAAS